MRSRLALAVLPLMIFGASLIGGLALASDGTGSPTPVADAQAGEPSYELTEFQFSYPWTDPITREVENGTTGVGFNPRWTTDQYPGNVPCTISILDSEGNEIGSLNLEVASAIPVGGPTGTTFRIEVSSTPNSAKASCGAGDYAPGEGYAFDAPTISRSTLPGTDHPDPDHTHLAFTAEWTQDEPGLRTCRVAVSHNGKTTTYAPFNLQMSNGDSLGLDVPIGNPESIDDADIKCSPLVNW
jgi:hypothetical protein